MSDASTTEPGNWLWRAWQFLVIPICYPIFVIGSILMILLVPIATLRFRAKHERTRWLRTALHLGARTWMKVHKWLGVLDVSVIDSRTQEHAGPVLVIANHPSLIDVLLITATLPNLCCVLKGALHYNPLFTLLIRSLDYLPNSDPERMLEEAQDRLLAGERLLIFPEGTRTEPGRPPKFRLGAAELALRSETAVLPVTIHCNSRYLSKGHPWYQWPRDKLRYRLELGPMLAAPGPLTEESSRADRRELRRAANALWEDHFDQRLSARGVGN